MLLLLLLLLLHCGQVEDLLYGVLLARDEIVTYCQLKNPKFRLVDWR